MKSGDIVVGNQRAIRYGYTTIDTHWLFVYDSPNNSTKIGLLGMPMISSQRDRHKQACFELQKYLAKHQTGWEEILEQEESRTRIQNAMKHFFPRELHGPDDSHLELMLFYVDRDAFNVAIPLRISNREHAVDVLKKLGDEIAF